MIAGKVSRNTTYSRSIRRLSVLFVIMADFVEIILVKLTDETSKIAVFEVLRKYVFCKLLILCSC
jgi:hypothetical protein